MSPDVLNAKLESLRRCLGRIETKRPACAAALADDLDAQDIICLNLERAVQTCVDIGAHLLSERGSEAPDTMAGVFVRLHELGLLTPATTERMVKAVGFRNVAVHAYQQIDWAIVYAIVSEHLDEFVQFAREAASEGRRET